MNTSKKTNTKKTLLIAMALCFMMPAMAQKSNDKTLFEQFRKKAKEVEQINRRSTSYTQKIDSIVEPGSKEVMEYDQNLNCTKITLYYANKAEKGWYPSSVTNYEYDAQNRVVSEINYSIGYEDGGMRRTYVYNDEGLLSEEHMWAKSDGEWFDVHYMTYEYDANGFLTISRVFNRNFNEYNSWYEDQRVEYTYSNGKPTLALYYYWVIDIQEFVAYDRTTWDYDGQLCTKKEDWSWNGAEWILVGRIEYTYYDNGNVEEETYSRDEEYNGVMVYHYRMHYQYDDHNNVTMLSHYNYQEYYGEFSWVLGTWNEMEYDMNVPASSIAGFALRYGIGSDSYYKDKLLKITTTSSYGYSEEQNVYYSTGTNSHAYVDLGLPSGLLWATCNVGAENPEDYGDYFAWGETQPKDTYNWSTYQYAMGSYTTLTKYSVEFYDFNCECYTNYGYNGFIDNLTTLLPEDDAATANWGSDWRMPTEEEWEELYNNTTVTLTTQNGVSGRLFTASNGNNLFLPAAGCHEDDLYFAGSDGYYWSSSLYAGYPGYPPMAWDFEFFPGFCEMSAEGRFLGQSVRPVRSSSGPSHTTQTVELSAGWNWFSTYLDITLNDLKSALVEAVPNTSISIKSRTQNTTYNPNTHRWSGSVVWDLSKMYRISVTTDCEITLTGTPINPANHPITISNGVNWIAYPLSENMSVTNAFSGFAVTGDQIKSRLLNAQYRNNRWNGQLNTLVPGQGYMYISNTQGDRIFTFPVNAK